MKSKKPNSKGKAKVKIEKLKLHKETVQNLSDREADGVKGGNVTNRAPGGSCMCVGE